MKVREVDTAISRANPITRAAASGLLSDEAKAELITAILTRPAEAGGEAHPPPIQTHSRPSRPRCAHRPSLRLATVLAAICVALASLSLFTAPGRAVSSWVGEQLGFGHPGGPPSLRDLRAFAAEGNDRQDSPAYVLLRGAAAGAGHYELVTFRMMDEPGKLWPGNGARCFELNLPEARALYAPSCGLPPARHGVRLDGPAGGSTRDGGYRLFASGRVSEDIATVEIEVNGEPIAVELRPIPEELIERFAIRRPFKFFFASLPGAEHGGLLTLTARDATGKPVAERRRRLIDVVQMEAIMDTHLCREAKRMRGEGRADNRAVRRSCRKHVDR